MTLDMVEIMAGMPVEEMDSFVVSALGRSPISSAAMP